jgi:hypothetical protein
MARKEKGGGKAGRRGGEVAASHNTGRALGCRGGKRGQRGAAAGERERREEREREGLCGGNKNRETLWTTMEEGSPEKTKFTGAEKKIVDWRQTNDWIDESKALG